MVILTIAALLAGVFYGMSGADHTLISLITGHTDLILYLLMFCVGISIGMQEGILRKIREYHVKILIIPLGITAASILGGMICTAFTDVPLGCGTAIASGMGWYSLAGALISKLGGAEMGSIAFMSNLMREVFSFLLIPLIARWFNHYTCIAPAGATSEDTTLPMMLKYTNEETVVLSVFNGVICSFFVPILIPLCFRF